MNKAGRKEDTKTGVGVLKLSSKTALDSLIVNLSLA